MSKKNELKELSADSAMCTEVIKFMHEHTRSDQDKIRDVITTFEMHTESGPQELEQKESGPQELEQKESEPQELEQKESEPQVSTDAAICAKIIQFMTTPPQSSIRDEILELLTKR